MKRNHDEFIALLAQQMRIDTKEASRLLRDWVDAIVRETEENGYCAVEELGTFRKAEDGTLEFQPDDILGLEVNHKFAGLRPIEISRPTTDASVAAGHDEKENDPPGMPLQDEAKPEVAGEEERRMEEVSEEERDEKEPEAEKTSSSSFLKPGHSPFGQPVQGSPSTDKPGKSKAEIIAWFFPVAAVLLVAVLLFFHFDGQRLSRKHIDDRAEISVPAPSGDQEAEPFVPELVPSSEPTEDDASTSGTYREHSPPYGLHGPVEEVLVGAYTIVVHSLRNERKSEIEKQRLENQDYKATQWSAVLPNGNVTYRVGIGQFQTARDAQRAVADLPEPFRGNNFIIRIR